MSSLKRKTSASTDAASAAKKPKTNGSITSFFGGGGGQSTGSKFDKAKWVAGLTAEQKKLLKLEIDTLHESWLVLLKDELISREFLELKRFLDRETTQGKRWFPPKEDVYSWCAPLFLFFLYLPYLQELPLPILSQRTSFLSDGPPVVSWSQHPGGGEGGFEGYMCTPQT